MNILLLLLIVFLLIVVVSFFCINILISTPPYRGPKSDHFDGQEFQNLGHANEGKFWDLIRWVTNRKQGFWEKWIEIEQQIPPVPKADDVIVTFINHSTYLIQTNGFCIITDPVWSERVSPFSFAGPKRNKLPGVAINDIPKIDFILLSHNHYDHLDLNTLKYFYNRDKSKILCPLGNAKFLMSQGILSAQEMDWWDQYKYGEELTIDCVPSQHFSGRSMFDRNQTLWAGYVLQTSTFGKIYFAGDTGYGVHFSQIADKYDSFELGLIPVGAYKPEWFMSPVHISPKEAVVVHDQLKIDTTLAMHFGTFALADDGEEESKLELLSLLKKKPRDIRIPENGQSFRFKKNPSDTSK